MSTVGGSNQQPHVNEFQEMAKMFSEENMGWDQLSNPATCKLPESSQNSTQSPVQQSSAPPIPPKPALPPKPTKSSMNAAGEPPKTPPPLPPKPARPSQALETAAPLVPQEPKAGERASATSTFSGVHKTFSEKVTHVGGPFSLPGGQGKVMKALTKHAKEFGALLGRAEIKLDIAKDKVEGQLGKAKDKAEGQLGKIKGFFSNILERPQEQASAQSLQKLAIPAPPPPTQAPSPPPPPPPPAAAPVAQGAQGSKEIEEVEVMPGAMATKAKGPALPPRAEAKPIDLAAEALSNPALGGAATAKDSASVSTKKELAGALEQLKGCDNETQQRDLLVCMSPGEKRALQNYIKTQIEGVTDKLSERVVFRRATYAEAKGELSKLMLLINNSPSLDSAALKAHIENRVDDLNKRLKDKELPLTQGEIKAALTLFAHAEKQQVYTVGSNNTTLIMGKFLDRPEVIQYLQKNNEAREAFNQVQVNFMTNEAFAAGTLVYDTIPLIENNFNFMMEEVGKPLQEEVKYNVEIANGAVLDLRRALGTRALIKAKLDLFSEVRRNPTTMLLEKGLPKQETQGGKNVTIYQRGDEEKIGQGNILSATGLIQNSIVNPTGKSYSETLQPSVIKLCERYIKTLDESVRKESMDELAKLESEFKRTGDLTPLNDFMSKLCAPALKKACQALVDKATPEKKEKLQAELHELLSAVDAAGTKDLTPLHNFMIKHTAPELTKACQALVDQATPEAKKQQLQKELDEIVAGGVKTLTPLHTFMAINTPKSA